MRKVLSVVLAATMAMSLAACGGSGAKTDTKTDTKAADAGTAAGDEASADDYYITIKFSNVFQPAEWNYKASEYLADLVKEKTDGHITLEASSALARNGSKTLARSAGSRTEGNPLTREGVFQRLFPASIHSPTC